MKISVSYIGKWRIVEMDQWDQEFVDLVMPGHVTVRKDGKGSFQFGAVEGELVCHVQKTAPHEQIEFTWAGFDEGDEVSGRGWVRVDGEDMTGHLFFDEGDDSGFRAKKTR